MNLELRKISDLAQYSKLKFNENNSKAILMSRRKRNEDKEVDIYLKTFWNKLTK